ncbi:MAG TPA: hypothetical protein VMX36_02590 [Sedimentisphaerales bacterium]|nr:hypothetical protein [Sedimentisphaerales bacterium]
MDNCKFEGTAEGRKCEVVDLGRMSPLHFVQYQQWHDVLIAGPTRNVVGTQGNDFPGLYYYDPNTRKEHVIMVDGQVDWSCSILSRRLLKYGEHEWRLVLGLFSDKNLGKNVELKHWAQIRPLPPRTKPDTRDAMPDQWEALTTLISKSFDLLPLPEPGKAYDWVRTAEWCLETLNKIKVKQKRQGKNMYTFFRTFRSSSSTYGRVCEREWTSEFKGTAELICQAGLSSSILAYCSKKPKYASEFQKLGMELTSILEHFYDPETGFFQNTFPPRGDEWERRVVDTWYAFHNLYHVMRVASLASIRSLSEMSIKAVDRAIRFVRACNYHIPLFAKMDLDEPAPAKEDGKVIGFAMNPSVLGMYARCLVLASTLRPSSKVEYYAEAELALEYLRRYPLNQLHHQTVQLAWAASAAHSLDKKTWRDDFTRCLLLNCYRTPEHAGLFQGCAGLMYPSFKETVEAVELWSEWLEESPEELHMAQILRLVLEKSLRFMVSKTDLRGLPQEGLATLEQPKASKIGIAIYAAPQVFDLARLQDDFKMCNQTETMNKSKSSGKVIINCPSCKQKLRIPVLDKTICVSCPCGTRFDYLSGHIKL